MTAETINRLWGFSRKFAYFYHTSVLVNTLRNLVLSQTCFFAPPSAPVLPLMLLRFTVGISRTEAHVLQNSPVCLEEVTPNASETKPWRSREWQVIKLYNNHEFKIPNDERWNTYHNLPGTELSRKRWAFAFALVTSLFFTCGLLIWYKVFTIWWSTVGGFAYGVRD